MARKHPPSQTCLLYKGECVLPANRNGSQVGLCRPDESRAALAAAPILRFHQRFRSFPCAAAMILRNQRLAHWKRRARCRVDAPFLFFSKNPYVHAGAFVERAGNARRSPRSRRQESGHTGTGASGGSGRCPEPFFVSGHGNAPGRSDPGRCGVKRGLEGSYFFAGRCGHRPLHGTAKP